MNRGDIAILIFGIVFFLPVAICLLINGYYLIKSLIEYFKERWGTND